MELPGLSSRPGIGVQEMIRRKFGRSVSPSSQEHAFFLVASFGRCKYKLSPPSVGAILQATIGGSAADFAVLGLADRVFRFSVSLSLVGFHIVKLCSFECSSFKIFFHLWTNDGPNWVLEWRNFCREEEASWTEVQRSKVGRDCGMIRPELSFADVVRNNPLTRPNKVPVSSRKTVFARIIFPVAHGFSKVNGKSPIGQFHMNGPAQSE